MYLLTLLITIIIIKKKIIIKETFSPLKMINFLLVVVNSNP